MTGKYESEETSSKWKYRWNFLAGSCGDLSFLPKFQVFSSLSTSMGCVSLSTSRLCHARTTNLCLNSIYSPRLLLLLPSLTTIQGSFPCSSRVITSGLEMEHPAWKNITVHNKERINLIEPSGTEKHSYWCYFRTTKNNKNREIGTLSYFNLNYIVSFLRGSNDFLSFSEEVLIWEHWLQILPLPPGSLWPQFSQLLKGGIMSTHWTAVRFDFINVKCLDKYLVHSKHCTYLLDTFIRYFAKRKIISFLPGYTSNIKCKNSCILNF